MWKIIISTFEEKVSNYHNSKAIWHPHRYHTCEKINSHIDFKTSKKTMSLNLIGPV